MREACPWQRTGGVVDHQVVDVLVRDAGLGKCVNSATTGSAGRSNGLVAAQTLLAAIRRYLAVVARPR